MTKKRFTFSYIDGVKLLKDNGKLVPDVIALELLNKLNDENEQLKKDRFVCLDCKHSGNRELGCLCEKQDCWVEYKTKCEYFEES